MKSFFKQYYVLFVITLFSAAGLWFLSYLTVLDFSFNNEEQYISSCNEGMIEEIETSIRYGKRLSNYYGIEQVLDNAKALLSEDVIITVSDIANNVLATTAGKDSFIIDESKYNSVKQVIHGSNGNAIGYIRTYYLMENVRKSLSHTAIISLIGSVGLMLFLLFICAVVGAKRNWSVGYVIAAVITVIILQGIFLTVTYTGEFVNAATRNVESVASYIDASIESVLEKGVRLDEIADLSEYLEEKTAENESIRKIYIGTNTKAAPDEFVYISEIENNKGSNLVLVYQISKSYIQNNVAQMVLMFVATIVLAVIVMKESLTLSDMISFRKSEAFNKPTKEQYTTIAKAIRYGNFLSVTLDYLCLSFSALQIKEWNQGFWFMSPAMAAALSISICSIADILGMIALPTIGKKIPGKLLMILSAILLMLANFNCFYTKSTFVMILMRFLSGVGTAGVKQVRNMVISQGYETEQQRNTNLSASNNGVIGGILCGMGLGGVIAGVFGYKATFLVAAIGNLLYLLFEFNCLPWQLLGTKHAVEFADDEEENLFVRMVNVLKSFSVWRTIILIVVPQYFLLMLIVYLIPGRIQSQELPGVVLTYANLLNGVAGLYLGERIYKWMQKILNSDLRVQIVVLILGAVSMFILEVPMFVTVMILISAILTGFVDGIGTPVTTDIVMGNARIMLYLNDTETLMLYSVIGSAVMSATPFILEFCEKSPVWMFSTGGVLLLIALAIFQTTLVRHK